MPYYWTCPDCGAHLDPCEKCDCDTLKNAEKSDSNTLKTTEKCYKEDYTHDGNENQD